MGGIWTIQASRDAFQCPNLIFCHLFGYVIVSSSTWYDAWQRMVVGLSSTVISFSSSLFSLSCQIKCTIIHFLFFNINPYSFNFLFCSYFFYWVSICFFYLLSMKLSRSHDLSCRFYMLTWVDSGRSNMLSSQYILVKQCFFFQLSKLFLDLLSWSSHIELISTQLNFFKKNILMISKYFLKKSSNRLND